MLGKSDVHPQLDLTGIPLIHYIDPEHTLCILAGKIDWPSVEKEFTPYYSKRGAPSIPVRTVIGILLLKQAYRFSDKNAVEHWLENPYWQYFCGEVYFQHKPPFYFSDLSHFRKRTGSFGEKKINELGTAIFGAGFGKNKNHQSVIRNFPFSSSLFKLGNYIIRLSSKS
jgi:transposase, IS5 family